jgi:hypothetical protein
MLLCLIHNATNYWLAGQVGVDQSVHSSAANLQFNGSAILQAQQRVRANYTALRDRGNLMASVSFSTTRQFDTISAAEIFAATYDAVFPRTGTLRCFRESGPSVCQLLNAVVAPPSRQVIGVTVMMSYTVNGGEWQALTPEGDLDPVLTLSGDVITMGSNP